MSIATVAMIVRIITLSSFPDAFQRDCAGPVAVDDGDMTASRIVRARLLG